MKSENTFKAEKSVQISLKLLLPLLASIMALSPLAIDLYLPAMPILAEHLATDMPMVQNSLSIYLLGYALGLILFGPMADQHSRRKMVIFGISGFLLASLLLPFALNIEQFLSLRFVQAFISSAATVVIPGTIREYYKKDTAKGLSYVSMIMMVAPMIAPSIGSILLVAHSWQLIFYVLALYSLVILVLAVKYLPDAIKPTSANTNSNSESVAQVRAINFLERYKIVFSNNEARLDIISSMMISLAFFSYITAIPFVYLTVYKVSELGFSVLFGINVAGLMTAHFINARLVSRKGSRKMLRYGLILSLVSSASLVTVTLLSMPVVFTVLSILPLMGSISMVAVNSDALVFTKFPEQSGTATAVIGTLRFGVGALAGPILAYFYDGSALPFAGLMFTSVLLVLLCQLIISINDQQQKIA